MPAVGCCGGSDVLVGSACVGFGDWLGGRDGDSDGVGVAVTAERVGLGTTSERVGLGTTSERVGLGTTSERVGLGTTSERVGVGAVLVGDSDAVTDGLSAAPPPAVDPQPARSDRVTAHSKVQGAARGTTGTSGHREQVCTTMPSSVRPCLTRDE